jgi:hypothetical protein
VTFVILIRLPMIHVSVWKLDGFTWTDPFVESITVSVNSSSNLSNSNCQLNCICKDRHPILGCANSVVYHQSTSIGFS